MAGLLPSEGKLRGSPADILGRRARDRIRRAFSFRRIACSAISVREILFRDARRGLHRAFPAPRARRARNPEFMRVCAMMSARGALSSSRAVYSLCKSKNSPVARWANIDSTQSANLSCEIFLKHRRRSTRAMMIARISIRARAAYAIRARLSPGASHRTRARDADRIIGPSGPRKTFLRSEIISSTRIRDSRGNSSI